MDTETIRTRISVQGWKLREIPIRKSSPDPAKRLIVQWRITAFKGEKSLEVSGPTIDDAIKTIGQTLGVIPRQ